MAASLTYKSSKVQSRCAGQRGLAMVEFCIGISTLLVVMYVSVEVGRFMYSYNTLTKAVRSGARYISTHALSPSKNVDLALHSAEAKNLVVTGELSGGTPVLPGFGVGDITLSEVSPSGIANPYINVRANYTYSPAWINFTLSQNDAPKFNFVISAATTMRVIR